MVQIQLCQSSYLVSWFLHRILCQCIIGVAMQVGDPTRLRQRRPALADSADSSPLPPSGTTAGLLPRPGQDGPPVVTAAQSSAGGFQSSPVEGAATLRSAAMKAALHEPQPAVLQHVASFPLQSTLLPSSADADQVGRHSRSFICQRQLL